MHLFVVIVDGTYGAEWYAVVNAESIADAEAKARLRYPLTEQFINPQTKAPDERLPQDIKTTSDSLCGAELRFDESGVSQLLVSQW